MIEVATAERRRLLSGRLGVVTEARGTSRPDPAVAPVGQRYLDQGLGLVDGLVEQASPHQPGTLTAHEIISPDSSFPAPARGFFTRGMAWGGYLCRKTEICITE